MTGLPFSVSTPPPSELSTNSASISSRWFLTSQSTPFEVPPSSSAVSARVRSRSGLKPFALQSDELGHPDGVVTLHVLLRAAAVVVAVLFDKLEGDQRSNRSGGLPPRRGGRSAAPAGARPCRADAPPYCLCAGSDPKHGNIAGGETGVAQALRHRFRSDGGASHGVRGVDLNELFENVVRKLPRAGVDLRQRGGRRKCQGHYVISRRAFHEGLCIAALYQTLSAAEGE